MCPSAQILFVLLIAGCGPQLCLASKAFAQRHTNLRTVSAATTTLSEDDELLACVGGDPIFFTAFKKKRIIISAKDQPFWEYYYTQGFHFKQIQIASIYASIYGASAMPVRSLNCKAYTPPPKPSSTFRKSAWPDDIIRHIASLEEDPAVHCNQCELAYFNMKFFEKCRTPTSVAQFLAVQSEVEKEGGDCQFIVFLVQVQQYAQSSKALEHTLQRCMAQSSKFSNKQGQLQARPASKFSNIAACSIESESESNTFIKKQENKIIRLQEVVASLKLTSESDTQATQLSEEILGLQAAVESRKQDIGHAKHIFEGL